MIRPAERFAVNITRREPEFRLARPTRLASLPMLIVLAAVLGMGLGGVLPDGWGLGRLPFPAAMAPAPVGPTAIEPAAGPPASLLVTRAADKRFYSPVLLDRIAVTMRIEPATPATRLSPGDAGRLAIGGAAHPVVRVGELALGDARLGPLSLQVGPPDTATSVLGADILDRLAVVSVEGTRLRLTPR